MKEGENQSMRIHIVQEGESLWSIANKYEIDFEALRLENKKIKKQDEVFPGMKIYIPVADNDKEKPFLSKNILANKRNAEKSEKQLSDKENPTDVIEDNRLQAKTTKNESKNHAKKVVDAKQIFCCYCMQPLRGNVQQHIPYKSKQ